MEICIVCYDGFDELDGVGPYEVFSYAARAGADCTVSLCTLDEQETVTGSNGLTIQPDGTLEDIPPDLLIVPGGGWNDRRDPSAWSEAQRGVLPERIGTLAADGCAVAGVCTGGMLLAESGILDGRQAVTHASALADLREYDDIEVVDARVVDSGEVLTAGGITSGIDLALYLVEREFGEEIADSVATTLEYERRKAIHIT